MNNIKRFLSIFLIFALIFSSNVVYGQEVEENIPEVTGKVVEIQKYGNIVLDIKPEDMKNVGYEAGDILSFYVKDNILDIPYGTDYSDVDTGDLIIRHDIEKDLIIVAINMGNFAGTYNVNLDDEVGFSMKEKEGYLSEYEIRQLKRTNNREDYSSDEVFANFREVTTNNILENTLYRTSSPVNNSMNRASYADKLAKEAGVKTVLNFADNEESYNSYLNKEDFNSPYYKSLYDEGNVILLNMGVDLGSDDFNNKLAKGLRFLITKEGPYLIHCNEGKDRAGFVSAVLEALMGASIEEIKEDYMTTYENYYHVEKDSDKYNKIAESNILTSMITVVAGLDKGTDIKTIDFKKASERYLSEDLGLSELEIKELRYRLGGNKEIPYFTIGKVNEIEKYGHASTDIKIEDFNNLGFEYGDIVRVTFDNGFSTDLPYLDNYLVEEGGYLLRAYPGHKTIAACINYGKFNEVADVKVGDRIIIELVEKEGYLDEYLVRKLERTNNREDYSTDEEFANFREINMGNIIKGKLYRSSSPVNNELNRAKFADGLIKKAGVKTVINLADSKEDIEGYFKEDDFNSPYYKELYENGHVKALGLSLSFKSDEFKKNLAEGLRFMAKNEGPYLVHCNEGKDRAGFTSLLLEALMEANEEEILEDYMISYINYYGVKKGSRQYGLIEEDGKAMLQYLKDGEENLSIGARKYMKDGGLTDEEIDMIVKNLSEKGAIEKKEVKLIKVIDNTKKKDKTFSIVVDAEKGTLKRVLVNGKELDEKYYEVKGSNLTVTLSKEYIKSLKSGKYKVRLIFGETDSQKEGNVNVEFVIPNLEKAKSPKTGDNQNINEYILLTISSFALLMYVSRKKKEVK